MDVLHRVIGGQRVDARAGSCSSAQIVLRPFFDEINK